MPRALIILLAAGLLAGGVWLALRQPAGVTPAPGAPAAGPAAAEPEAAAAAPLTAEPAPEPPPAAQESPAPAPTQARGGNPIRGFGADDVGPVAVPPPGSCMVPGPGGLVDLGPTLRRLGPPQQRAEVDGGEPFANARTQLPERPAGHYRAYAVDGARDEAQRIVIGAHAEVFYSRDRGRTFTRVSWRW